jgi:hypothetical protein
MSNNNNPEGDKKEVIMWYWIKLEVIRNDFLLKKFENHFVFIQCLYSSHIEHVQPPQKYWETFTLALMISHWETIRKTYTRMLRLHAQMPHSEIFLLSSSTSHSQSKVKSF